jgi:hypothetical protein
MVRIVAKFLNFSLKNFREMCMFNIISRIRLPTRKIEGKPFTSKIVS